MTGKPLRKIIQKLLLMFYILNLMASEKDNILEFNQYMMSDKMLFIVYTDIESLIKILHGYENDPEKSSTANLSEHVLVDIQSQLYGHLVI